MTRGNMTKEEASARVKHQRDWANEVNRMLDVEAFDMAAEALEDIEALNAINLDLASENEDLVGRIGKLIGYIDFLRSTAQGKKESLNLLEKVVKGELEEIRAEGENFVKPKMGEWIPVTERLPEEDGEYLLFGKIVEDEDNYIFIGDYDACAEQFGIWQEQFDRHTLGCLGSEFLEYTSVLAWQPLPQPYKESEE